MSQVKKLQGGGIAPTQKKIIFNGKEYTEDELNEVANATGKWFKDNSNYSSDISESSALIEQIKNELKSGKEGKSDVSGTSLSVGDRAYSNAGKTNQNIFGNWSDKKLGSAISEKIADAFRQLDEQKNTQSSTTSSTTVPKSHYGISKTLSDRYFGGNWTNAQKGIGELKPEERLAYMKESLKDVVNSYRTKYNEDSPFISKLKDIDIADAAKLKKIAYELGEDISPYLDGTEAQQEEAKRKAAATDPYASLREEYDINDTDEYLKSFGYVAAKNKKTGYTDLLNASTKERIDPTSVNGYINSNWGTHYGKGIFYNPTLGFKWGTRGDFKADSNYFNIAEPVYAKLHSDNKAGVEKGISTIDFNTQIDPNFAIFKDSNNKFEYVDATGYFSSLGSDGNRLIIPKNRIGYTDIGQINLQGMKAYMFDKELNKNVPVTINLSETGSSQAVGVNGKVYDLGAISKNANYAQPQTTYKKLESDYTDLDPDTERRLLSRIVGYENTQVTPSNINDFLLQITRNNFTNNLSKEEAANLANLVKKYAKKYNLQTSERSIINIQNTINKLAGATGDILTTKAFFKKGGVIKYQIGGGVKATVSNKAVPTVKTANPNLGYGSARLKDSENWTAADKLDAAALAADALSLTGGVTGIAGGLAGTGLQLAADLNRGSSGWETVGNLAVNLGFTALAAVPGLSALKFAKGAAKTAKIASTATKELKTIEKSIKFAEKVAKIGKSTKEIEKLGDVAQSIKDAKTLVKNPNFIKTFLASENSIAKGIKGTATAGRVGLSVAGVYSAIDPTRNVIKDVSEGGINSARISDLRGVVGGIAGLKGLRDLGSEQLIKQGTKQSIKPTDGLRTVEVKTKNADGVEIKEKIKISEYTDETDATKKIKQHYNNLVGDKTDEISKLQLKKVDGVENKDLDDKIDGLQKEIDELTLKSKEAKFNSELLGSKVKNTAAGLKNKGANLISSGSKQWEGRVLKPLNDDAGWFAKLAHNTARKSGFTKDGYQMTEKQVLDSYGSWDKPVNTLNTLFKNPGLLLKGIRNPYANLYAENLSNRKNIIEKEKELWKNYNKLRHPAIKYKTDLIRSNKRNLKKRSQEQADWGDYGGFKFKKGGQLIPKGQNSLILENQLNRYKTSLTGKTPTLFDATLPKLKYSLNPTVETKQGKQIKEIEANLDKIWNPKSALYSNSDSVSGHVINTPVGVKPGYGKPKDSSTPVTKTPDTSATQGNGSGKVGWENLKKGVIGFDKRIPNTLAQYVNSRAVNRDVAKQLASVKPVLQQMPSEVYKPVVTNLANENFVNNQATSYLRQASKPMTSDASFQRASQLEAMSKTAPLLIQARAANTDMYNQTLGASKDSAEKYGLMRNEVANANLERLGAHDARIANIYATKRRMDGESTDNLLKQWEGFSAENRQYKQGLETALATDKLQNEYTEKLKPSSEKVSKLVADIKNSDVYQRWAKNNYGGWEDYKENGILGTDLYNAEIKAANEAAEKEASKWQPYYKTKMLALQYQNPNRGYLKSGGSIDSKVEIQNLKNKMKAKELDAKYTDKTMDRKQKEVSAILKGMSKESLFLLKTMLGK